MEQLSDDDDGDLRHVNTNMIVLRKAANAILLLITDGSHSRASPPAKTFQQS